MRGWKTPLRSDNTLIDLARMFYPSISRLTEGRLQLVVSRQRSRAAPLSPGALLSSSKIARAGTYSARSLYTYGRSRQAGCGGFRALMRPRMRFRCHRR
jgi:hypothetical protein